MQSVICRGSDERIAAISRGDLHTIMSQAALAIWDWQTNTRAGSKALPERAQPKRMLRILRAEAVMATGPASVPL